MEPFFYLWAKEGDTQALLSAICYLLSAICYLLSAICYLLSALWRVVTPLLYAISVV